MKKLILQIVGIFRDLFDFSGAREELADEKYYTSDLNIAAYAGKWRKAKELVAKEFFNPSDGITYWLKVRTLFLELGGEYQSIAKTCDRLPDGCSDFSNQLSFGRPTRQEQTRELLDAVSQSPFETYKRERFGTFDAGRTEKD